MIASDKLMNNDKPYFYRDNWYSFAAYGDFIVPVAEGYHIKNDITKFFQHDDFPTWSTEFNFTNEVVPAGVAIGDKYISESNGENCVSFKLIVDERTWTQNSTFERTVFKDRPDYMTWDPKRDDGYSHIYMPTNANNLFRGIRDGERVKIKGFNALQFNYTKDAQNAFYNCNFDAVGLTYSDINDYKAPSIKKAQSMFEGCRFPTGITFDATFVNNANRMNRMFRNSSGNNLYVMLPENVEQHSGMFSGAVWNNIYVNGFGRLFDSNSNAARSFGSTDLGYGKIHLDPIPYTNISLYNSDISSQFAGCDMLYTSGSVNFNVDAVKNMQHTFDNCKMNVVPYIGELFGDSGKNYTAAFQNARNFNVQFYRSNVYRHYNNWNLSSMFKDSWDINVSFTPLSGSQSMLAEGYLSGSNLSNMFYSAHKMYIPCNSLAKGFSYCNLKNMFKGASINLGNNILDQSMTFSECDCSSMFQQSFVNINATLGFYHCNMDYTFCSYGASNSHVTVNISDPVSAYGVASYAHEVYITGIINSWNKANLRGLYAGYNFNNRFMCGDASYNDAGTPGEFYLGCRYYNNSSLDAYAVSNYMFKNSAFTNGYRRFAEAYLDFSKAASFAIPRFPESNSVLMFSGASIRFPQGGYSQYCSPESFANAHGLFSDAGVVNYGIFCYDDYADYRINNMSDMFHGNVSKAASIGGMSLSTKEDYWKVVSKFNVYLIDTDENTVTVDTEYADGAFSNSRVSWDCLYINRSASSAFNTALIDEGYKQVFLSQYCSSMRNMFRNCNVQGDVSVHVDNADIYANNAFRAIQGDSFTYYRIYLRNGSFWNWRRWENAFYVDLNDYKEVGEHYFYISTSNQQTYDSLTNRNGTIWSTIAPTLWRYGSTAETSGGYYWVNWALQLTSGTYNYKFAIRKI